MAKRKGSVTIRHVAEDAGVSHQTVSRVINKQPNVRPAVKDKVLRSIEKLGYVPSIAAQRMGGSRSYLILALNDRTRTIEDWQLRQGTDWIDQMLYGAVMGGEPSGYRLVVELIDTHADHVEREISAALAALSPDGVILTPPHSQNNKILDLLEDREIAVARIGVDDDRPGIMLTMDDERAARLATEHLAELGHRSIGFIAGSPEYAISSWRVDGWRKAMESLGFEHGGLLEWGDFSAESGHAAAGRLFDRGERVTAIIASNDQMALATLREANARGLAVPRDLSLVSFDDTPMVRLAVPPLTAIDQPIAEVSAEAIRLLIEAKAGKPQKSKSTEPIVIPARLTLRHSTAAPGNAVPQES
ncbi:LacI family DNA-binding transcriptional regulator [Porphyrobacter algicida]|uniref:LacI family DNA-binding transcriptional regulator n=1 Tax=Qipengyuania algicida TaxID=1836209 RepID=A0A845AEV3_9SPHN|nr:LacI family DNA-binding transcriptional regulator [Qipengyuania algicida]MXP27753.1 LacI family DNA-binding transcriptional regulator [Qipengyuania algicida]